MLQRNPTFEMAANGKYTTMAKIHGWFLIREKHLHRTESIHLQGQEEEKEEIL
jgi:hypothetical protein